MYIILNIAFEEQSTDDPLFELFDLPFEAAKAYVTGGWQAGLLLLKGGVNIIQQVYKSYKKGAKVIFNVTILYLLNCHVLYAPSPMFLF